MVRARLRIWGYRCFSSSIPTEIEVINGFTAFIGPNNSGKSSLLKFFYDFKHAFKSVLDSIKTNQPEAFLTREYFFGLPPPVTDPQEVVCDLDGSKLKFELEFLPEKNLTISKLIWEYDPDRSLLSFRAVLSDGRKLSPSQQTNVVAIRNYDTATLANGAELPISCIKDVLDSLSNIQYIGPFRNAINEGAGSYYDLALGTGFVDQWHQWKTGPNKSQNKAIQKVTEDVRRLIAVNKLEINASVELKTLQIIINDRPHKLSELGSGIAQLIIVLGNALIKKPTFILIDEPETHLHPSLQIDFLTSLASYASSGIFYATHSLGLARSVSDQCYSVIPNEKGSKVNYFHKTPRYAEFLGSMGIAGLQEIGCSHVLCVEGTTDVRTFQQFLRKFGLERKVVIIPLGGESMIKADTAVELADLLRLGAKVSVVIDSERKLASASVSKGRLKFKENCDSLKIKCHILERRATENYFTQSAINKVFNNIYHALSPYEVPSKEPNAFWGKSENWRIAQSMEKSDLENTDLGQFIKNIK